MANKRDRKEYFVKYYQQNKGEMDKYTKEYYANNKEFRVSENKKFRTKFNKQNPNAIAIYNQLYNLSIKS